LVRLVSISEVASNAGESAYDSITKRRIIMNLYAEFRADRRIRKVVLALLAGCFMLLSEHALAIDISDDFDDNKKNTAIWGADTKRGDGHLNEVHGHLEFTVTSPIVKSEDTFKRLLKARGPYNANWETQIDLVNSTIPSKDLQISSFGIDMYHCEDSNDYLYAELYASHYFGPPPIKGFHAEIATDDVVIDWLDTGDLAGSGLLTGSVRFAFDSVRKIISVSYRYRDGDWIPFGSYDIDAAGWSMTSADQFCFKVYGWSKRMRVAEGKMYGDNFRAKGFTPVVPQLLDLNGGEIVPAGQSDYPITWEAPSETEKFKLQYSMDKGETWETIVNNISGSSHEWEVPVPKSNKKACLIKITGYTALGDWVGTDESDEPFTIEVASITAPIKGEIVPKGTVNYSVGWVTHGISGNVNDAQVFYTLGNSGIWKKAVGTLVDPLTGFLWNVPSPPNPIKAKLKVVFKDLSENRVATAISNVFRIE